VIKIEDLKYEKAIESLKQKLINLEKRRIHILNGCYYESEIIEITSAIREVKRKIKALEKLRVSIPLGDKENGTESILVLERN
jgi:hypothetical protein